MEVIIQPSPREVCALAARITATLVRSKPGAVLGLATGGTPRPMYAELVRLHRSENLDFKRVSTFNLDEYVGLGPDHPCSYHKFMAENFFDHVNIPPSQIHIPDGLASDVAAFCQDYEAAIRSAGGIDLQILGIGEEGHIGFNEPSSSLSSRTRIKTLTQKTLDANKRFFAPGEAVPRHVITMGVGTIMEAKRCLLLACGQTKASAVSKMVEGPVTAMAPASALQFHPTAIVIVDDAAASHLALVDYYRSVYRNKPDWQRYD